MHRQTPVGMCWGPLGVGATGPRFSFACGIIFPGERAGLSEPARLLRELSSDLQSVANGSRVCPTARRRARAICQGALPRSPCEVSPSPHYVRNLCCVGQRIPLSRNGNCLAQSPDVSVTDAGRSIPTFIQCTDAPEILKTININKY